VLVASGVPCAHLAVAQATHATRASTAPPAASEDDGAEGDDNPYAVPSAQASARGPVVARIAVPEQDGMLLVPGGRFTMGSADRTAPPNERPPHGVTVAPFWMDRTEVSVSAYRACVDAHVCPRPEKTSVTCTYDLDDAALPVSCVRWQDAEGYCRFVGKRLPHEAEWEFAARGANPYRYPWGGWGSSCSHAVTLVYDGTGKGCAKRPARVGTHVLGASVWGVLDLSGNVEEWTADWYAETYAGAAPRQGASHTLRGGGWLSAPSASKTTSRDWGSSLEAGPNVGFRCAKDAGDAG
jgi:formylglycine-generating enzyme required for sulfatase activity